jgi:hypothetical protein
MMWYGPQSRIRLVLSLSLFVCACIVACLIADSFIVDVVTPSALTITQNIEETIHAIHPTVWRYSTDIDANH